MRRLAVALALLALTAAAPNPANRIEAQPAGGVPVAAPGWGIFDEIARREWTTQGEARVRISRFAWAKDGALVARHGSASRLDYGDAKFADTVQRMARDPATGDIAVTYSYDDGRPPLKTVIRIQPDGSAIESFTDSAGVQKRNIHKLKGVALNTIERQELRGGGWVSLGVTRKTGLTAEEIAENKRRAEEERLAALEAERLRKAAEQAQREAEEAEREAERQAAYAEEQASAERNRQMWNQTLTDAARMIGDAVRERNEARANLERLRLAAQQETARKQAEAARQQAQRIAEENARRMAEVNARQEAIRQQNQQRQADSAAQAQAQQQADAQRRAEAQRRAAEQQAQQDAADRQREAEADRQRREAQAAAEAERRRQAEQARLAELRRKEEEARRPVAFREGVVACLKRDGNSKVYRCQGPLQTTFSDLVSGEGQVSLGQACGTNRVARDLGMSGSYRIFGCGFGIHPTARDYPGNRDVPADLGLYVTDRATFYCPKSTLAYCRNR